MALFTIKYAPKQSAEIIGQEKAMAELKEFILNYKQQKMRAALLVGPIGCGKTSAVYALANELQYDLLEINSSDARNEEHITSFLSSALGQQSLFFRPKIVLLDEIDNLSGTKDRGCIPALVKAIETAKFPIILTANDPYDSKFKPLQKVSRMIEFQEIPHTLIAKRLQQICQLEAISAEEKAINTLARQSAGDLRSALIDVQICSTHRFLKFNDVTSLSDRKRTASILQALALIFKSSNVENVLPALENVDADTHEIVLWLDENMPKEYISPRSLARAYEVLARADIFQGRITRRQHWRFLAYINDLLTAGISNAKEEKNAQFIPYKPTMRILNIWQAKMKNAKKKEIALKLAAKTHCSTRVALEQIPYLRVIAKNKSDFIVEELQLTEEEAEWLS